MFDTLLCSIDIYEWNMASFFKDPHKDYLFIYIHICSVDVISMLITLLNAQNILTLDFADTGLYMDGQFVLFCKYDFKHIISHSGHRVYKLGTVLVNVSVRLNVSIIPFFTWHLPLNWPFCWKWKRISHHRNLVLSLSPQFLWWKLNSFFLCAHVYFWCVGIFSLHDLYCQSSSTRQQKSCFAEKESTDWEIGATKTVVLFCSPFFGD